MNFKFSTDGIVIKRTNYSESDKILTIYSKANGKLVVLAKGIRKINSKKAPHLELFNHVRASIVRGKSIDIITEALTIEVFKSIRLRLERTAYAYRISELIDRLCPQNQVNYVIYELLLHVINLINTENINNLETIVDEYTINLLWELGYLEKGKSLSKGQIIQFIENIIERKLKSDKLLTKLVSYNKREG